MYTLLVRKRLLCGSANQHNYWWCKHTIYVREILLNFSYLSRDVFSSVVPTKVGGVRLNLKNDKFQRDCKENSKFKGNQEQSSEGSFWWESMPSCFHLLIGFFTHFRIDQDRSVVSLQLVLFQEKVFSNLRVAVKYKAFWLFVIFVISGKKLHGWASQVGE